MRMKWFFISFAVEDNKIVTILSSIDVANEYVTVNLKINISNKWETVEVKQPMAIHKCNAFMNGFDKSDQILNTNNVLSKCLQWWKTLFFYIYDRYCPSQWFYLISFSQEK